MNLILTAYLTSGKCGHKSWQPKRSDHWRVDINDVYPLINSVSGKNIELYLLHDCFTVDQAIQFPFGILEVPMQNKVSSNSFRWEVFLDTVKFNQATNHIFLVDSTDVECYINPFDSDLGDFLWTGDEKHARVSSPWMKKYQEPYVKMPDYQDIINENRKHWLLNCGIVGGKREIVLEYLEYITKYQSECNLPDNISVDMAIHNYVIFKHFKDRYKHGVQVNTVFRKNEKPNGVSWWKHK